MILKYSEEQTIQKVREYIKSTYEQHYVGKNDVQIQDLLDSIDIAIPFCQANAMKYLARYGKKKGYNELDLLKAVHYIILLIDLSNNEEGNDNENLK